ncbi:hypothetical protein [Herbiconiux liangxiaofengii]|uniref:hypothetical protein n=1 Tax=Herbiconiux liangxiaofengii TaxID=3342795 RepID=UPI0035B6C060
MDACARLCSLVGEIVENAPDAWSARRLMVEIGVQAAGVRRGPFWLIDAATGGRNVIRGTGFAPPFDDATRGQARHFAGIVAVAARLGPGIARRASIVLGRDHPDSADGRLTDAAVQFARLLSSGELTRSEAADWLARRMCAAGPAGSVTP